MENIILAESILERVNGLLRQLEDVTAEEFINTEELLHQLKDELEDTINN